MSDLINEIRHAQVLAGEQAVIDKMKRLGFMADANDLDKCETQLKQACQAVEVAIDEYIGNYELYGEDDETGCSGIYTPTEQEIMLIEDAIQGLLSDTDFVTSFNLWQDQIKMHTSA